MRHSGNVRKGWGSEEIWVTNENYCSKFMHFRKGAKFSMHFHDKKVESWYVLSGRFIVSWINTNNATTDTQALNVGDIWHNDRLQPHQLYCDEEGTILEVSTADSVEDNYRVFPGDSQK